MADKYDSMIDSVSSAPQGGDKYDSMIDAVSKQPQLADILGSSNSIIARGLGSLIQSAQGVDPTRALLTNEPTQGIAENVLRGLPATVGSVLGGSTGFAASIGAAPLTAGTSLAVAPGTAIASAGVGGAAGEALRQAAVQAHAAYTGTDYTPTSQILSDVGTTGAISAAGEGIAQGMQAAAPFVKKAAAGYLRVGPNIPTKVGEAVINDPGILSRALTPSQMSDQYGVFQTVNGLTSPAAARGEAGNLIFKPGEAEDVVNAAYQKILGKDSVPASTQELYEASQAARFLRDQAGMANPQQAANLGNIVKAKDAIDSALETATADSGRSYSALRKMNFESKAAEMFKSPYPVNVNGQPNVLRSLAAAQAGSTAGAGLGYSLAGGPGAAVGYVAGGLLGPGAVSPAVYGGMIRAGASVSPIAQAAAKGFIMTPGTLAAYYNSPGTVSH